MRRYRTTPDAEQDISSIVDYIAEEATVEQAMRVADTIRDAIRRIAEMPGLGHFREEVLDQRYRFFAVYSYLIVFRADVDPIQIIAIVHGARDLPTFFKSRVG